MHTIDSYQYKEIQKGCQEKFSCSITLWIFQIIAWISLSFYISAFFFDFDNIFPDLCIALRILSSIIYFIVFLVLWGNNTSAYLRNSINDKTVSEIIKEWMMTLPKIEIYAENYHTRGKGEALQYIVTHSETGVIPYISWKDISGMFRVHNPKNKRYLRLHIETEISIADEISYAKYIENKNRIDQRNKGKDTKYIFTERRIVEGIKNDLYLLKFGNNYDIPILMSNYLYLFTCIFGFGMIYKSIFDSRCVYKHFIIRKILSLKYDITNDYKFLSPSLYINDNLEKIDESKTSNCEMLSTENDIIYEEDINKAKEMYKQYIPRFHIFNDGKENWIEEYYDNNTNTQI